MYLAVDPDLEGRKIPGSEGGSGNGGYASYKALGDGGLCEGVVRVQERQRSLRTVEPVRPLVRRVFLSRTFVFLSW